MADILLIDIGASPNDGLGDPLREAFNKINSYACAKESHKPVTTIGKSFKNFNYKTGVIKVVVGRF